MSSDIAVATLVDGPLRFLPKALLAPRRPLLAILVGWLVAAIPALLLAAAVQQLLPDATGPEFPIGGWWAVFLLAIFSPVIESLIMAVALNLLLKIFPASVAIVLSAVGWGILHGLLAPGWGLVIWWPFLIFSTIYTVWRSRGFLAGVGMASAVHGLNNLLPALTIAFAPMLPVS